MPPGTTHNRPAVPLPAANHEALPSAAAPALPSQMSPDGREVWAWADAFSRHTHRMNRLRELRSDHFLCGRECGDCDKWMKSRECPRERNVNGQSRGPSCKGAICGQFVWSRSAEQRRDRLATEIAALSETPTPADTGAGERLAAGSLGAERLPEPREEPLPQAKAAALRLIAPPDAVGYAENSIPADNAENDISALVPFALAADALDGLADDCRVRLAPEGGADRGFILVRDFRRAHGSAQGLTGTSQDGSRTKDPQ